jgi:hypothetical protein
MEKVYGLVPSRECFLWQLEDISASASLILIIERRLWQRRGVSVRFAAALSKPLFLWQINGCSASAGVFLSAQPLFCQRSRYSASAAAVLSEK